MKAADDQVTKRKGTKAIPFRKHSIALPRGGRRAPRCGEARAAHVPARRAAATAHTAAGGRLGGSATAGQARPGREGKRGERSEAAGGEAAAPGWVGRGRPGLVAKQ